MARVVLDLPKLRANPRFKALVKKCGDEFPAFGMLACFYESAQDFWAHGKLMPRDEFDLGGYSPILEVGLAEEKDGGIYAKGSERFDWLKERVAGGQKSAANRKKKYGTSQPNPRTQPELSSVSVGTPAELTRTTPEPTSTSTSSSSIELPKNPPTEGRVARLHAKNPIAQEIALQKRAPAIADKIIGVLRQVGGDELEAERQLPKFTMEIIRSKWVRWENFAREAANAYRDKRGLFFEAALKQTVTAGLLLAVDGQQGA